jgi:hypothetical protein
VQERRGRCRLADVKPLSEQGARQPGEHVAGAGGGQPAGAGRVDKHRAGTGRRDHRRGALEQHAAAEGGRRRTRVLGPPRGDLGRTGA